MMATADNSARIDCRWKQLREGEVSPFKLLVALFIREVYNAANFANAEARNKSQSQSSSSNVSVNVTTPALVPVPVPGGNGDERPISPKTLVLIYYLINAYDMDTFSELKATIEKPEHGVRPEALQKFYKATGNLDPINCYFIYELSNSIVSMESSQMVVLKKKIGKNSPFGKFLRGIYLNVKKLSYPQITFMYKHLINYVGVVDKAPNSSTRSQNKKDKGGKGEQSQRSYRGLDIFQKITKRPDCEFPAGGSSLPVEVFNSYIMEYRRITGIVSDAEQASFELTQDNKKIKSALASEKAKSSLRSLWENPKGAKDVVNNNHTTVAITPIQSSYQHPVYLNTKGDQIKSSSSSRIYSTFSSPESEIKRVTRSVSKSSPKQTGGPSKKRSSSLRRQYLASPRALVASSPNLQSQAIDAPLRPPPSSQIVSMQMPIPLSSLTTTPENSSIATSPARSTRSSTRKPVSISSPTNKEEFVQPLPPYVSTSVASLVTPSSNNKIFSSSGIVSGTTISTTATLSTPLKFKPREVILQNGGLAIFYPSTEGEFSWSGAGNKENSETEVVLTSPKKGNNRTNNNSPASTGRKIISFSKPLSLDERRVKVETPTARFIEMNENVKEWTEEESEKQKTELLQKSNDSFTTIKNEWSKIINDKSTLTSCTTPVLQNVQQQSPAINGTPRSKTKSKSKKIKTNGKIELKNETTEVIVKEDTEGWNQIRKWGRKQLEKAIKGLIMRLYSANSAVPTPAEITRFVRFAVMNPSCHSLSPFVQYLEYLNCLRIKDLTRATDALRASFDIRIKPNTTELNKGATYAAYNFALFYDQLGYKEDAISSLAEAFRAGHAAGDSTCLHHCHNLWSSFQGKAYTDAIVTVTKEVDNPMAYLHSVNVVVNAFDVHSQGVQPDEVLHGLWHYNADCDLEEMEGLLLSALSNFFTIFGWHEMIAFAAQMILFSKWKWSSRFYASALSTLCHCLLYDGDVKSGDLLMHYGHEIFQSDCSIAGESFMLQYGIYNATKSFLAYKPVPLDALQTISAFDDTEFIYWQAYTLLVQKNWPESSDLLKKLMIQVEEKWKTKKDYLNTDLKLRCLLLQAEHDCLNNNLSGALSYLYEILEIATSIHSDIYITLALINIASVQCEMGLVKISECTLEKDLRSAIRATSPWVQTKINVIKARIKLRSLETITKAQRIDLIGKLESAKEMYKKWDNKYQLKEIISLKADIYDKSMDLSKDDQTFRDKLNSFDYHVPWSSKPCII